VHVTRLCDTSLCRASCAGCGIVYVLRTRRRPPHACLLCQQRDGPGRGMAPRACPSARMHAASISKKQVVSTLQKLLTPCAFATVALLVVTPRPIAFNFIYLAACSLTLDGALAPRRPSSLSFRTRYGSRRRLLASCHWRSQWCKPSHTCLRRDFGLCQLNFEHGNLVRELFCRVNQLLLH
jgi:hypothetical protein